MIWSAMVLGLISSLHCAGMCGPLQAAALGAMYKNASKKHILLYHISRIFIYGILGAFAGIFGQVLGLENWQQEISLFSGLFLLFAFAAFYFFKIEKKLLKILLPFLMRFRANLEKNRSSKILYFSGSGMLNGLLPCGMVYLAIFPAIATGQPLSAALFMVIFGLGTLPLLFLVNVGALKFLKLRLGLFQKAAPVFVIATALLLILRGMDLGVPFLSPNSSKAATTEICEP